MEREIDMLNKEAKILKDTFDKDLQRIRDNNETQKNVDILIHKTTLAHMKQKSELQKKIDEERVRLSQEKMSQLNQDFQANLKKVQDDSNTKAAMDQKEMDLIKKHQTDMANLQKQLDDSKHEAAIKVLQEQLAAAKAENALLSERAAPVPAYVVPPHSSPKETKMEFSLSPLFELTKEAEEKAKSLKHMVESNNPGFLKNEQFWQNLQDINALLEKHDHTFRDNAKRLAEFQSIHFSNTYRKFQNARNYVHQLVSQVLVHAAPKKLKSLKKGT